MMLGGCGGLGSWGGKMLNVITHRELRIAIMLAGLMLFDVITTAVGLSMHINEANPAMAALGIGGIIGVKGVVGILVLGSGWLFMDAPARARGWYCRMLKCLCIVQALVILNNLIVILGARDP